MIWPWWRYQVQKLVRGWCRWWPQSWSDEVGLWGLSHSKILYFVSRDSIYAWSIHTLDRRLWIIDFFYNDKNVTVDDVRRAVETELAGSRKQLGYKAMHEKIRQLYEFNVPWGFVHDVMYHLDPEWLEQRDPCWKKRIKGLLSRKDLLGTFHRWLKRYRPRFC